MIKASWLPQKKPSKNLPYYPQFLNFNKKSKLMNLKEMNLNKSLLNSSRVKNNIQDNEVFIQSQQNIIYLQNIKHNNLRRINDANILFQKLQASQQYQQPIGQTNVICRNLQSKKVRRLIYLMILQKKLRQKKYRCKWKFKFNQEEEDINQKRINNSKKCNKHLLFHFKLKAASCRQLNNSNQKKIKRKIMSPHE